MKIIKILSKNILQMKLKINLLSLNDYEIIKIIDENL